MNKYNIRELILAVVATVVLAGRYLTDPSDTGGTTLEFLMYVCVPAFVVLLSHLLRKVLVPYVKMENVYKKAMEHPIGAGAVWLGMCLIIFALFGLFGPSARAQDVTTYIPPKAIVQLPVLVEEQKLFWSTHPNQAPLQG